MIFRRRDKRPILRIIYEFFWPKGGWARAAHYIKHRVRRLPDTPEKISRGIWAGVFATFTPFYGMHFLVAASVAKVMRGNIFAALLATFFGNPLTYVPIGVASLNMGHWLLGTRPEHGFDKSLGAKFAEAGADLWHNFKAVFTRAHTDWSHLHTFYDEVFFPYMIGGIVPGVITATVVYYLVVPLIRVYQNRRRKALRLKLEKLRPPSDSL